MPGVGTTSYSVTFTPTDSTDYSSAIGWVNVTVNACGLQDSTNSSYSTALYVYIDGETPIDLILDAEGINESAICAVNAGPTDVTHRHLSLHHLRRGSTYPADSNSYGTNAAVLAYGTVATAGTGATITINDDGAVTLAPSAPPTTTATASSPPWAAPSTSPIRSSAPPGTARTDWMRPMGAH